MTVHVWLPFGMRVLKPFHRLLGVHNHAYKEKKSPKTYGWYEIEGDYNFVALHFWMLRFVEKYNIEHNKQKCEKGSAEYAAIQLWIANWLKSLHEDFVLYDHSLT